MDEHPEGLHRVVGNDAVIDDQNEEGTHQAKDVDQKGGHQHVPVDAPGFEKWSPRTSLFQQLGLRLVQGFPLQPVFRADEDGIARIELLQFRPGDDLLPHARFRQQDLEFFAPSLVSRPGHRPAAH